MGFIRYVGRQVGYRAVQLALLLVVIITLLFALIQFSGNPAVTLVGEGGTAEEIARVEAFYGLDQPLSVQYGRFLRQVVVLDFGRSYASNRDALGLVIERVPATLQLAVVSMVMNLIISVAVGAWLGYRPTRPSRRAGLALVLISQGIPFFVVGLITIQIFAVRLNWLPSIGNEGWRSLILPAFTLASLLFPRTIRLMATNVEEALTQNYVRTVRSYGASPTSVMIRHVIPNALLGVSALMSVQFGFLLSGSLVAEAVFSWPGLGLLLVQGVRTQDFPIVQASVFVVAILVFIVTAITDVLLPLIDPRIRTELER